MGSKAEAAPPLSCAGNQPTDWNYVPASGSPVTSSLTAATDSTISIGCRYNNKSSLFISNAIK